MTVKILLENMLRNAGRGVVRDSECVTLASWRPEAAIEAEMPFMPARVLLQDFTGVPAVVDLAAMRDAMADIGGDPARIEPLVPADLVIDHSVQVDQLPRRRTRSPSMSKASTSATVSAMPAAALGAERVPDFCASCRPAPASSTR